MKRSLRMGLTAISLATLSLTTLSLTTMSAEAEPAQSPYRITWSFANDELSTIDVDSGDLSSSRFTSPIELATFMRKLPRAKKSKGASETPPMTTHAAPPRELRIEQVDGAGKVRSTDRWIATVEEWRRRLGERMVDRLEDEFDAHLRMLLPRVRTPEPAQ